MLAAKAARDGVMDGRLKKLKWNSFLAIGYQLLVIISGFVLPRFYLHFYGSEINGLINSITQFLAFINICDLGIGAVVSSALYKPLAERDMLGVSRIFVYAKKFFRIVSFILIGYVIALTVVFPFMSKPLIASGVMDVWSIVFLVLAMSISQFGQYFIGINYQILLNADQRSYVQLATNGITLLLNTVISVLLMWLGLEVWVVRLVASLIYLARPLALWLYARKKYQIDHKIKPEKGVLPQQWNGIIQHLAYMINENTDVMILSIFSGFANVSVYSVYVMVVGAIKTLITSATTGVQALFGNMIAKGEKEGLQKAYDLYDWGIHTVSVLLFTVAGILIVPFVSVYTKGLTDADYTVPLFAILITVAFALNCLRNNMYTVIRAAGHYKQTQWAAITEACINLTVSIALVYWFGLVGVAIGTLVSALFFTTFEMVYLSKHILHRKPKAFIFQVLIDVLSVGVMIASTFWLQLYKTTYLWWIVLALIVFASCAVECLLVQLIFKRKQLKAVVSAVLHKFKKKKQVNEDPQV